MPDEHEALCVYCRRRPADGRWVSFCSERCRLMDLAAWLDGTYRLAGERVSPETDVPHTPEAET